MPSSRSTTSPEITTPPDHATRHIVTAIAAATAMLALVTIIPDPGARKRVGIAENIVEY